MRTSIGLGVLGAMGFAALTACGNGGTAGTGGTTGTGGGSTKVNGCDPTTAADHTADATTAVVFGGTTGLKYAPACIKIKKGHSVKWTGDFTAHPLSGGLDGAKDAASPITEATTGMSQTITFPATGTFGFFCEVHFSSGMEGAVFVE